MNWLFAVSFTVTIVEITSFVEEHVTEYFNSDLVQHATELWEKHQVSYQNMISVALQESYGYKPLNAYIKSSFEPLFVTKGFYHNDNQVHIVLEDLTLDEYPHISDPEVIFPLTTNVIKVEALVSKIIIHASYIQFRNTSQIVFDLKDQNSYSTSPFLFEQVKTTGRVAITAEGCKLSGMGITTLTGYTVSLGNMVFRLLHCQFNFEIYSPGSPSPPVIVSYLPNGGGLTLEHLVMRPLSAELALTLQTAIQTHVNASSVFQKSLFDIRIEQERIFEKTTNYMNNVIRNLNVLTISRNIGKIVMDDFRIPFNDTIYKHDKGPVSSVLTLSNMVLTGLETVYSSHTGGPFKLATIKISDELRFGTLQVRGSVDLLVGDQTEGMFDFAVEIEDVEVDITFNIEIDDKGLSRKLHVVEVMGWRSLQFSSTGMRTGETLITGYLITKVPVYLHDYLNSLLSDAAHEADEEYKLLENGPQAEDQPNEYNDPQDKVYDENNDLDNGQNDYAPENYEKTSNGDYEGKEELNAPYEEELNAPYVDEEDGMIGDVDNPNIIVGVTKIDDQEPVTGPGGVAVDVVPAPGDYGEALTEEPGEIIPLQPKFFDDNMFAIVKNQNNPALRKKDPRIRAHPPRKWRKHLRKPALQRATRTTKYVRSITENEIR